MPYVTYPATSATATTAAHKPSWFRMLSDTRRPIPTGIRSARSAYATRRPIRRLRAVGVKMLIAGVPWTEGKKSVGGGA
jgi:hypothetical protein